MPIATTALQHPPQVVRVHYAHNKNGDNEHCFTSPDVPGLLHWGYDLGELFGSLRKTIEALVGLDFQQTVGYVIESSLATEERFRAAVKRLQPKEELSFTLKRT